MLCDLLLFYNIAFINLLAKLLLQGLWYIVGLTCALSSSVHTAGCYPEEVVGLEVVDLVEEGMESGWVIVSYCVLSRAL